MGKQRFLVVTYPGHGHIHPGLQFASHLLRAGADDVTFATTSAALRRMIKPDGVPDGLSFAIYSDGRQEIFTNSQAEFNDYLSDLSRFGSESIADILVSAERGGRPFTRLVYTVLIPWAGRVARDHHVPPTFLWIQPATVFDIYYYYFNGYGDLIRNSDPLSRVDLPGLPTVAARDLPSFLQPSSPHSVVLQIFQEQMQVLSEEERPKVLVNTFDPLENEALTALHDLELIAVGPLISLSPPGGRGDLRRGSDGRIKEWLDSKAASSVIFASYGSYSVPPKAQREEMARALLESGKPFLWVIRALEDDYKESGEEVISCREELEKVGMIVPWCSQLEVLSHPAIGCFVTHCGWNSTLESLAFGVPAVAFPLWTDQVTNAMMIEEVWRTGARVEPNEEGVVESGEIGRCLEVVMGGGERGEEIRRNSSKWKLLARDAIRDGGSSDGNLKAFVKGGDEPRTAD